MPKQYDTSFKELFAQHFPSLLPWLLPGTEAAQVLKLPEELPITARRADLMLRVQRTQPKLRGEPHSPRREELLLIFECQCQRDSSLPGAMLTRAVLAHALHKLPVKTVLLALTPQAVVSADYAYGEADDGTELLHSVTVRRVFDEPADAALARGITELLPLVTLMRAADGNQAALVRRVTERIIAQTLDEPERKNLLGQAATFATLRLSRAQVDGIFRDVLKRYRVMLDPLQFPYIKEHVQKQVRSATRKARSEGEATGKAKSIVALLEARGIRVSPATKRKILGCTEPTTLDRWLRSALTASSAAEVVSTP